MSPLRWLLAAAVLTAALGGAGWLLRAQAPALVPGTAVTATAPAPSAPASATALPAPAAAAHTAAEATRQALWAQRLARREAALATYREATRYPHNSRPAAEQPDQMQPNRPIVQRQPLRMPGDHAAQGLELRTTQQRVFVQGDEDVVFTLAVLGADGQPRPLTLTQAFAHAVPAVATAPQVPLAPEGDGPVQTLRLHPASQGFAGLETTIRVEVGLQSGDQRGYTYFDISYSPTAPATWAGAVRDRLVAGSLRFELPVQVAQAGRYVATGRVDDAQGRPFALVSFNEWLPAGRQTIALTLFGKLVRDAQPPLPLRLRDVEAFLLHENRTPDRALLPRLAGPVHTSGLYPPGAFSDAEWHSEERSRYIDELTRNVDEARRQLGHPDPEPGR